VRERGRNKLTQLSTPHRIASFATVRHGPLYARELQRRSDAVRRSCECGVEVRHSTAAIHQQDRPCHSHHITRYAPASTRKTAEAKSRYVHIFLSLLARVRDWRGEGVCYEPNQVIKKGGIFLLNRQPEKCKCQRTLSRPRRTLQYVNAFIYTICLVSLVSHRTHPRPLGPCLEETLTTATRRGKTYTKQSLAKTLIYPLLESKESGFT
jgi:hypothetical protein